MTYLSGQIITTSLFSLTGIMFKGNHSQMAARLRSVKYSAQWCIYIYNYIYIYTYTNDIPIISQVYTMLYQLYPRWYPSYISNQWVYSRFKSWGAAPPWTSNCVDLEDRSPAVPGLFGAIGQTLGTGFRTVRLPITRKYNVNGMYVI